MSAPPHPARSASTCNYVVGRRRYQRVPCSSLAKADMHRYDEDLLAVANAQDCGSALRVLGYIDG